MSYTAVSSAVNLLIGNGRFRVDDGLCVRNDRFANELYSSLLVSRLRPFHAACSFLDTAVASAVNLLIGNGRLVNKLYGRFATHVAFWEQPLSLLQIC